MSYCWLQDAQQNCKSVAYKWKFDFCRETLSGIGTNNILSHIHERLSGI